MFNAVNLSTVKPNIGLNRNSTRFGRRGEFTLDQLSNAIVMEFDANHSSLVSSGGLVDSWTDKRGSGGAFTQTATNRPTIGTVGGLTAVSSNGSSQYMVGNATMRSYLNNKPGFSMFIAYRPANVSSGNHTFINFQNNAGTNPRLWSYAAVQSMRTQIRTDDSTLLDWRGSASELNLRTPLHLNRWHIVEVIVGVSDNFIQHGRDGFLWNTGTGLTGSAFANTNAASVQLFANVTSNIANGAMARIVLMDRRATQAESLNICRYIERQLGLTNLVCRYPIVISGNSLSATSTITSGVQNRIAYVLEGLLNSNIYGIRNLGVGGSGFDTYDFASVNTALGQHDADGTVIIQCGTNNINGAYDTFGTGTAEYVKGLHETWYTTLMGQSNAPTKIISVTQPARGSDVGMNQEMYDFNQLLKADTARSNAVADIAARAKFDPLNPAVSADTTWYNADRVHIIEAGVTDYAPDLEDAIVSTLAA